MPPAPTISPIKGLRIRLIVYPAILLFIVFVLPEFTRPNPQVYRAEAKAYTSQIVAALKQYQLEYSAFPTGSNAQILAALRGANARKIVFFECNPDRINAQGELTDRWKTPYRIDTTRPDFPWAYSFGPDKQDSGGAEGSDDIASWR